MQVRIHVRENQLEPILSAAEQVRALFEQKGLQVAKIDVLASVYGNSDYQPPASDIETQNVTSTGASKTLQNPEANNESPSLSALLEQNYGTHELNYVSLNANSVKKIQGKLLSEFKPSELVMTEQGIGVLEMYRRKLIELIRDGKLDAESPYPVRLYWTEKALILAKKLEDYTYELLQ